MHRKKIQQILDKIDNKTYMKIGVNRGDNFTKINAKRKVGVILCHLLKK